MRSLRIRLTSTVALYGGVLSVLALYVTLTARVADGTDYYTYELSRPMLVPFLRNAGPALISGVAAAAIITYLASQLFYTPRHPLKWVVIGGLYGAALPFLSGALIPTGGVLVDLVAGTTGQEGFFLSLENAVLSTPLYGYVYGMLGLYVGLLAGLLLAIGGFSVDLANTSENPKTAKAGPYVISASMSLAVAIVVIIGPFSLFELLVEGLGR